MGNLTEFDISYSHEQGVYHAGSRMEGIVTMVLSEPMKMRNLRVWVYGRAKVHWTKSSGSGSNRHTKHYRAEEVYVDQRIILFGSADGESQEHPVGRYTYSFHVDLPVNIPSSFEGEYGYVRYLCKATIDRPWKFDHDLKAAFTVVAPYDLNYYGSSLDAPQEGSETKEVTCCCCVSGTISATFKINKKGFVPGENMIIFADVKNNTNSKVDFTRVAIKQYITFYGVSDSLLSSGELKPKQTSEVVAEIKQEEVQAGQSTMWEMVPLRIPPVPPSELKHCRIIDISYVVKFYVNAWDVIKLTSDIVIGTVPLFSAYSSPGGAVITQPLPSAPPGEMMPTASGFAAPPPSYEECVKGQRKIKEDFDSDHTRGQLTWAPSYPTFNLLTQANIPSSAPPPSGWNVGNPGIEENRV